MSFYTKLLFDPARHDPVPFLGQRVVLPELEKCRPAARALMEYPILDMESAQAFGEMIPWLAMNYDETIHPNHWGVICARTLEAVFWRLQDMAQPRPVLGVGWPHPVDTIGLFLESAHSRNLARDLIITLDGTGRPARESFKYFSQTPASDTEREACVRDFWAPVPVPLIAEALWAWDALRFSYDASKDKARRFQLNMALFREQGLAAAWEELFGPLAGCGLRALDLEAAPLARRATTQRLSISVTYA